MAGDKRIPPQYDCNAEWDAFVDLTIRRFVYSSIAGGFGGFILFRSSAARWSSAAFGAGLALGSAYKECSQKFDGFPAKMTKPKISDPPAAQGGRH